MHSLVQSLGPIAAIIGMQWGDEGKGKVTDILGEKYDVIARACGGANAGHTIVVNGKKYVFNLLPAGCLHAGKPIVLGAGMVIHLPTLLKEIQTLQQEGVDLIDRLYIAGSAHILFDYHKEIDGVLESRRAEGIGTTKRGIGPAYMDKAARTGVRMSALAGDMQKILEEKEGAVQAMFGVKVQKEAELASLEEARTLLGKRIIPSLPDFFREILDQKKSILIEGAQATLLDIDHGTYPYVTSSATTAAGALQGLGLPPSVLTGCIGVAKAYCTRVGAGIFHTEEIGPRGDALRERGGEYGSNTGRPRRCGWLNIPELQYSAFINGCTAINITKLDVLDTEKEIPVGMGNDASGNIILQNMAGWQTSTRGIREFSQLPKQAQALITFVEEQTKVPVRLVGTGPDREEIIVR